MYSGAKVSHGNSKCGWLFATGTLQAGVNLKLVETQVGTLVGRFGGPAMLGVMGRGVYMGGGVGPPRVSV